MTSRQRADSPSLQQRLRRITARVVVFALCLEAVFQLYAWLDSRQAPGRPRPDAILVVGGDQAFGAGITRTEAFPSALRRAARPLGWNVSSRAAPTHTLARLSGRLPAWLDEVRPEVLVVVLENPGTDVSDAPVAALKPAEFRLGWRTAELLGALFDSSKPTAGSSVDDLLGAWHLGKLEVRFEAAGAMRLGEQVGTWQARDDSRIEIDLGAGSVPVQFARDGNRLQLSSTAFGTLQLTAGRPGGAAANALERIRDGDLELARWALQVDQRGANPSGAASVGLIELDMLEGRPRAARRAAARFASDADPNARHLLCRSALAVGDTEQALALSIDDLASLLEDESTWWSLATAAWPPDARRRLLSACDDSPEAQALAAWLERDVTLATAHAAAAAAGGIAAERAAPPWHRAAVARSLAATSATWSSVEMRDRDREAALVAQLAALQQLALARGIRLVVVSTSAGHPLVTRAIRASAAAGNDSPNDGHQIHHLHVTLEEEHLTRRWAPIQLTPNGHELLAERVAAYLESIREERPR